VKGGQVRAYMAHKILRQFWPREQMHLIDIGFTFDFVHEDFFLRIFIAIAAWWLSQFSPTSCQNSLLFRCERILSLTSLLQIICIRMQCSLDDRVYFICQDSLQAISEAWHRGRKENEEHLDFITYTPEKQKKIVAEGVCGSHFIVFSNRWVQTQFCLFLFESWCERQHFLFVCSMRSLVYILCDNRKLLFRLLLSGIETRSIFHAPHWRHRYICRRTD